MPELINKKGPPPFRSYYTLPRQNLACPHDTMDDDDTIKIKIISQNIHSVKFILFYFRASYAIEERLRRGRNFSGSTSISRSWIKVGYKKSIFAKFGMHDSKTIKVLHANFKVVWTIICDSVCKTLQWPHKRSPVFVTRSTESET